MDWQWIKANKGWVTLIVIIVVGSVLLITDTITWDQFMSWLERADVPLEGGG